MRAQFVNVNDAQPSRGQRMGRGAQREIGEMLVIDGVVLPPFDEAKQMRELQRDQARVLDQCAQAGREAPDIGHVGEYVVSGHQVGPPVLFGDLPAGFSAQELHDGLDSPGVGRRGDIGGRLDAKHRDLPGQKMLQQIAVIARNLGHQAAGIEAKPADHFLRVPAGVRHP